VNKEIAEFLQSVGGVSGKREEPEALQNPSATKQEITKLIERLELLEEKSVLQYRAVCNL